MKRKLFIGSSKEGETIATTIKEMIQTQCGDWIEPKRWADKNVFLLNKSTLRNLVNSAREFEYGIFFATADDLTLKKENISHSIRDNVLFEAGMFLGSLGLSRAFLLIDNVCGLPTDFAGTTISLYDSSKPKSLIEKIEEIIDSIKKTQYSYKFSVIPSTALAIGYFDNFIKPFAEEQIRKKNKDFTLKVLIPKQISDILSQINIHALENNSKSIPVFNDENRPVIFEYPSKELWDIPTTLITLNTIIEKINPYEEIGNNFEKEEWVALEVRNFIDTLNFLVSQDCICKGRINITRL